MDEGSKNKSRLRKVKVVLVSERRLLEMGLKMIENMIEQQEIGVEDLNLK